MTNGASSLYYLTDVLGAGTALTDSTGTKVRSYTYAPRGADRTATEKTPQPYRSAAGYKDPTGVYHLGARCYDPTLGRLIRPGPSGQEKHLYLYTEGDPAIRPDPQGLVSLGGLTDARGPVGDVITGAAHVAQGDTQGLWGYVSGVVAGGLTFTACASVATVTAPATRGGSLAASVECYAMGWSAGHIASNLVSGD
ncbi:MULTISPECIES: RHS repeat-associated core domain-containing protein [unclassified Streptomyces]|uniref:RHS repeat-associated core domain-containing protein n=1 Tax=unclassified Streptomyces TaxID=2593676 RepID=UPI0033E119E1